MLNGADIRRFGLSRVLLSRILIRLRDHLGLHLWSIQVRPLYATYDIPEDHTARFTFKRLTRDEALEASKYPALDLNSQFVNDAFDRHDICVGAFDAGRLVAYTWRTLSAAPVAENLWLKIDKPNLRYGYKAFVLPEYRGIKLNSTVRQFFDYYFLQRGITHDIGYVALYNLASFRNQSFDRGRRYIGYAGFLEIGKHCWPFRTPGVRHYLSFEVRPTPGKPPLISQHRLDHWRQRPHPTLKRFGIRKALYHKLMGLVQPWLEIYRVYIWALDPTEELPSPKQGFSFRFATEEELLDQAARDPDLALTPQTVKQALARGDVFFAVFKADRIIKWRWLCFSSVRFNDDICVGFEKPYCLVNMSFTHPSFRGEHVGDQIWKYHNSNIYHMGYTHTVGTVATHNFSSIAVCRRNGTLVGWTGFLSLFGKKATFRTPGVKKINFGLFLNDDTRIPSRESSPD